jgi:hypothetical protein
MLRHVAVERTDVSVERFSELRFLVTANVVHSSPILVTLMLEATRSSETSVFTSSTRRHIPENAMLLNHRRENL